MCKVNMHIVTNNNSAYPYSQVTGKAYVRLPGMPNNSNQDALRLISQTLLSLKLNLMAEYKCVICFICLLYATGSV